MKTTLEIQNLKCGGCAHTIISKLNGLKGIQNVSVNIETNTVSFDNELPNEIETATTLLSQLGYPVDGDANSIGKKSEIICKLCGRTHGEILNDLCT